METAAPNITNTNQISSIIDTDKTSAVLISTIVVVIAVVVIVGDGVVIRTLA